MYQARNVVRFRVPTSLVLVWRQIPPIIGQSDSLKLALGSLEPWSLAASARLRPHFALPVRENHEPIKAIEPGPQLLSFF